MAQYVTEAFRELKESKILEEDTFSFDKEGAEELKKFMDGDIQADLEVVIDPEADDEEELEDSYDGKVILECDVCHSLIYKDPEDVVIDEEEESANVGEDCPYCQNPDGYKIIGQVSSYDPISKEKEKIKVEDEEEFEESLGSDIDKYQEWVDYDMKRYHKISDKTMDEIKKAGLSVTKDQYGDYEVIGKDKIHEALKEAKEKKDVWDKVYGELTMDGEQVIKNGSPRINKGAGYDYKKEMGVDRAGNIVVKGKEERDLKKAIDIADSHGLNYNISKSKNSRDPYKYYLTIEFSSDERDDYKESLKEDRRVKFNLNGEDYEGDYYGMSSTEDGMADVRVSPSREMLRGTERGIYSPYEKREIRDGKFLIPKDKLTFINEDKEEEEEEFTNSLGITSMKEAGRWLRKKIEEYGNTAYFSREDKRELNRLIDDFGNTYFWERALNEDTVKQNGKWVNKGADGTHGKFRTKKAADAQRRAMFANGYKEELEDDCDCLDEKKSRRRDDIDADADDKKERAKRLYMRKRDDADSDRDYRLKKAGLKEKDSRRDDIDADADDKKERAKKAFMKRKDDADSDRDYKLKKAGLEEKYYYIGSDLSEKGAFYDALKQAGASSEDLKKLKRDGFVTLDKTKFAIKDKAKKGTQFHEDFSKIEVETDDQEMKIFSDDDGKIQVESKPRDKHDYDEDADYIEPVTDELRDEIEDNTYEDEDEEDEDIVVDEFDEEEFDELGESYLKKVYDNVSSYKTTKGYVNDNKLKLEGVITFNSGKQAKTNFIFESKYATKTGKLKFLGENKQISPKKNSFTLTGRLNGKKLVTESLTYNYRGRDAKNGSTKRLYGTVSRKSM